MIEIIISFLIGLLHGIYQQPIRDWVSHYLVLPFQHWQRIPWDNEVSFAGGNLTGFEHRHESIIWDEGTLHYIDKCLER